MAKETKYDYEYVLQGYYYSGDYEGWEDLTTTPKTKEGLKEIRVNLNAYKNNDEGDYRIVVRRTLRNKE